jgi:hypothetical protein
MADGTYTLFKKNSFGAFEERLILGVEGQALGFDSNLNPVMLPISSGSAAGSNTQIQYNNNGSFGASQNFIWSDGRVTTKGTPAALKLQREHSSSQLRIDFHDDLDSQIGLINFFGESGSASDLNISTYNTTGRERGISLKVNAGTKGMRIAPSGSIGVGIDNPEGTFHVVREGTGFPFVINRVGNVAAGAGMQQWKARGSIGNLKPANYEDTLGGVSSQVYTTSGSYLSLTEIQASVVGGPSANPVSAADARGRIRFSNRITNSDLTVVAEFNSIGDFVSYKRIVVGTSDSDPVVGTIQYYNNDLQGYVGSPPGWKSLTQSGGGSMAVPGLADQIIFHKQLSGVSTWGTDAGLTFNSNIPLQRYLKLEGSQVAHFDISATHSSSRETAINFREGSNIQWSFGTLNLGDSNLHLKRGDENFKTLTFTHENGIGIFNDNPEHTVDITGSFRTKNPFNDASFIFQDGAVSLLTASPTYKSELNFIRTRGNLSSLSGTLPNDSLGSISSYMIYNSGFHELTKIEYVYEDGTGNPTEDFCSSIRFFTTIDGSLAERFRINRGGLIGINTANPDRRLHVNGDVKIATLLNKSNDENYTRVLIANDAGDIDFVPKSSLSGGGSTDVDVEELTNASSTASLAVNKFYSVAATVETITVSGGTTGKSRTVVLYIASSSSNRNMSWVGITNWQDGTIPSIIYANWAYMVTITSRETSYHGSFVRMGAGV